MPDRQTVSPIPVAGSLLQDDSLKAHAGHLLVDHLRHVGDQAARFAMHFDGEDHARLAGLLHDVGKAEQEFQQRIRHAENPSEKDGDKIPHAHHGAALALDKDIWPVAFAVNGHHAGLHNRHDLYSMRGRRSYYIDRAKKYCRDELKKEHLDILEKLDQAKVLPAWLEKLPFSTSEKRHIKLRAVDLYTRFVFSALIDADRLDAEKQHEKTRDNYAKRHNWRFGENSLASVEAVSALLRQLKVGIEQRWQTAKGNSASQEVLDVRAAVLENCTKAAANPPGVFTLTVPTGGGKTLASVYFALKHIEVQNGKATRVQKLRRIIIVIPYLNIIQQTADELKKVFQHSDDDPVILEHHSQAQDPAFNEKDVEHVKENDWSRERTLRQLAAENWDAPIIVTTSVQFFDSLFSRRTSDARKLHNIAQSVVIFDEVQTFPPRLMQPILDVLGELTDPRRPYSCSLVLCTATQPALGYDEANLRWGLSNWRENSEGRWAREPMREIVENPQQHFKTLQRTTYQWPEQDRTGNEKTIEWDELADQVLQHAPDQQALIVLNTRRHARKLFEVIREKIIGKESRERSEHLFHLSTWMTPAHRLAVLGKVKERLEAKAKQPCLLVSTQCIEAGVDVDFPAVWRAFGPYDAIVQAAGRCNRNGKRSKKDAIVRIFHPKEKGSPVGVYATAISQTALLSKMDEAKPDNPTSFETYFRLLYQVSVPDECEIQRHREQLRFKEVSENFQVIEAFTAPLIIVNERLPGTNRDEPIFIEVNKQRIRLNDFIEQARHKGYFTPTEWQCLQPHIVNLDYRDRKTPSFLGSSAKLIFNSRDDNSLTGLYALNASLYQGGLNGYGLDVLQQDLSQCSVF